MQTYLWTPSGLELLAKKEQPERNYECDDPECHFCYWLRTKDLPQSAKFEPKIKPYKPRVNSWLEWEDRFLRKSLDRLSLRQMSDVLHKTPCAISLRRGLLNLPKKRRVMNEQF